MRLYILFTFLFCSGNLAVAQIISQFTFDVDPVTTADVGPNGIGVSGSAFSAVGGVGGTNGLNAGLPKANIAMIIPSVSGVFDVVGIDVSFDYQREENAGRFFQRGSSLSINGCANFSVSYRVDDGVGGFNTVTSGNVYAIPNDDTYRNYRFFYTECDGLGALLVDGVVVWSNDGPDNRAMYWTGSGNIMIAGGIDATGSNDTFFDNLIIGSIRCSPLPIELVSFDAHWIDNNRMVMLEWKTASEINNDYFTIERSLNGAQWEELIEIDGAGNSSSLLTYDEYDTNPFLGVSYYRLKQTDFDGEFSYSQIKSVNINKLENSKIEIYPNPTDDQITIIGNESELKQVKIYSTLGQDVTMLTYFIINTNSKMVIDLSNLSTGMYYIKTKSTANKVYKQ